MTDDQTPTAPTRRSFLTAGAAIAIAGATVAGAQDAPAGGEDDITLALVNGRIHTMDAGNNVVSSVTIRKWPVRYGEWRPREA